MREASATSAAGGDGAPRDTADGDPPSEPQFVAAAWSSAGPSANTKSVARTVPGRRVIVRSGDSVSNAPIGFARSAPVFRR